MKKLILIPILFLSYLLQAQYIVVKPSQLPAASTINLTDLFILNQGTTTKKVTYNILNTVLKDTFTIKKAFEDSITALNERIVQVEPPAGGYANNLYFDSLTSVVVPAYKTLTYNVRNNTYKMPLTVNESEGDKTIASYIYPMGVDVTLFPSGLWSFNFYGSISSANGVTQIGVQYFKRNLAGTDSTLLTVWSSEINNTTDEWIQFITSQPNFIVAATDKMGARILAKTTSVSNRTVTIDIGNGYGAYLNNPNRIRHSQLRALNGDTLYLHVTKQDTARWNAGESQWTTTSKGIKYIGTTGDSTMVNSEGGQTWYVNGSRVGIMGTTGVLGVKGLSVTKSNFTSFDVFSTDSAVDIRCGGLGAANRRTILNPYATTTTVPYIFQSHNKVTGKLFELGVQDRVKFSVDTLANVKTNNDTLATKAYSRSVSSQWTTTPNGISYSGAIFPGSIKKWDAVADTFISISNLNYSKFGFYIKNNEGHGFYIYDNYNRMNHIYNNYVNQSSITVNNGVQFLIDDNQSTGYQIIDNSGTGLNFSGTGKHIRMTSTGTDTTEVFNQTSTGKNLALRKNSVTQMTIDANANIRLYNDGTVWEDLMFPFSTGTFAAAGYPSFNADSLYYEFTIDTVAPSQCVMNFVIQMPHKWKEGSTIYPHVHYKHETGVGTPTFKMKYKWYNNLSSTATSWKWLTMGTTSGTTDKTIQMVTNSGGVSGSGKTISSIVVCQVYLTAQTGTGNVNAYQFDIHYEIDALGSDTITTK